MTIHLDQTDQLHEPRPHLYWATRAACKDADPGLFFPFTWDGLATETLDQARRICHACPVRAACLDWALRTGEPDGVWGGTTPDERRSLRARHLKTPA
ncbi:WhiB family transcriptional regulator [Nonomuraea sp. NPDC049709]|uniref:WhiB family transcriptional regulator n=1 Tax=Nonomuraea sp. NPDC049709 TaxID=3154736 RepID=UPI00342D3B2C